MRTPAISKPGCAQPRPKKIRTASAKATRASCTIRLRCSRRCCAPLPRSGAQGILESLWDFHIRHYSLPQLKAGQVAIALPAVFTKYVSGVPDLHVPGYDYQPYRDTADFHYDVHNGFYQTRVGNDSDLIHFFKSSGPELEEALIACLKGADSHMKIEVLKAGSTLSGAGDAQFAKAALKPGARSRQRSARQQSTMSMKTASAAF